MSEISEARQALRDYAREEATVVINTTFGPVDRPVGMRGELAGHVFQALQNILTQAEDEQLLTLAEVNAAILKAFNR